MNKVRSTLRSLVVAAALVVVPAAGFAQDARVAQQVKLRQAAFTVLGAQMSQMGAMAAGRAPYDAKAFRLAAERAAFMATIVPDLFPTGSVGGKVKDELWQNSADFQKLMSDMKSKTAALSAAAAKGESFDALKPLFGAAGGSCKACHDKYKAD